MANQFTGQALSDSPALKPYRRKPAVRNFRGGDGNVGIIRSPVRAIALPDYGKEDSESILASSLASDTASYRLKRRQGYRWAGLRASKSSFGSGRRLGSGKGGRQHGNHAKSRVDCQVLRSLRTRAR
jgi:hypothetical protein